ncbi:metallopeptidase TldD-related protein [Buchnera aphidicola]|uniref:metallopeptidase TldD-related protein n=1 Tax=Buchnera aphidicola TaxID=9 RepID=UPI00094D3FC4|nr:metallopeptidase TldD-related protein [Buchnera aphidicola]
MLLFDEVKDCEKKFLELLTSSLFYLKKKNLHGSIELNKMYGFFVSSRYKNIDKIESYNNVTCLVTIYNHGRKASVLFNNVKISNIYKAIDKAINISKYTDRDIYSTLPKRNLLFNNKKTLNLFFPWSYNFNTIVNLLNVVENSALEFDSKITNTEGATFDSSITLKYLGNTYDWLGFYRSTYNYLSHCAVASNKTSMERDFVHSIARDFYDLKSPEFIGRESARKSILKLNAKKIKTQRIPVIFASDIAAGLFKYLISALNGHAIYKKTTFLLDYFKKKIFPEWLNIFEDPFLEKGLFSQLFDHEGVATTQKKIINRGCIETWLLDTYSGNQLKYDSTGHAGGTYNWLVNSSKPVIKYPFLFKEIYNGLLITELFGNGVNIMTGDYSRGACGFWIRQGKIDYAVSEITISGNLIDIWRNIITLSDDVKKDNRILCSSILVENIQVSGK